GGRAGGGDQRARHSKRLDAGRGADHADRPDPHGPLYKREQARPRAARAEQFLRLRRHELQFDFWPRRMKLSAYIEGIGVLGPGLHNWPHAAAILSGSQPYIAAPTVL